MNKNELSLCVSGQALTLAEGTGMALRVNKAGKELGVRLSFVGSKSATELKEEGKGKGLKGAKLREYVDASLRGDASTAAWTRHGVAMEQLRKAGAVPVELDGNKAGTEFKAKFVVPSVDPKAEADKIEAAKAEVSEKALAALIAAGLTVEQAKAALA